MKSKRIIILTFSLLLSLVVLCFNAQISLAKDKIDLNQDVTLNVSFIHENEPIENVEFKIYRVADLTEYGQMSFCGDFTKYADTVDLYREDQERYAQLGETLKGLVEQDGIEPYDISYTDIYGDAFFPKEAESMKPGVYLVLGTTYSQGNTNYYFQPSLIALPTYNSEDGTYNYDVTSTPKYDTDDLDKMKIFKIWNSQEDDIPVAYIDVDILRDGKYYQTVRLTKEEGWTADLGQLEKGHSWSCVEKKVPEGWYTTVNRESYIYQIENYVKPKGDYSTPTPTPTPPSSNPPKTTTPPNTPPREIPFTAVVWWPVPTLAAVGLGFLTLGVYKRKK